MVGWVISAMISMFLVPGEDDQLDGRRDVIAGYLCTDSTCSSESRLWLLGVLLESYFVLVWL